VPGIHNLCKAGFKGMNNRDKPGHDESGVGINPSPLGQARP
jgi:hypothetical protein